MSEVKEKITVDENNNWEEALENEAWVAPLVDIYETENDFYLTAFMPGIDKNNVKIKLEEGNLILMGKNNYSEELNRKYVLKESETGNYFRKFRISDSVDDNKINANFDNGVLKIVLPKHDRIKPKTIEIQ